MKMTLFMALSAVHTRTVNMIEDACGVESLKQLYIYGNWEGPILTHEMCEKNARNCFLSVFQKINKFVEIKRKWQRINFTFFVSLFECPFLMFVSLLPNFPFVLQFSIIMKLLTIYKKIFFDCRASVCLSFPLHLHVKTFQ